MFTNDLAETNKLLTKIWFELKEHNARQRRLAGEPEWKPKIEPRPNLKRAPSYHTKETRDE